MNEQDLVKAIELGIKRVFARKIMCHVDEYMYRIGNNVFKQNIWSPVLRNQI